MYRGKGELIPSFWSEPFFCVCVIHRFSLKKKILIKMVLWIPLLDALRIPISLFEPGIFWGKKYQVSGLTLFFRVCIIRKFLLHIITILTNLFLWIPLLDALSIS